MTIIEVKNIKKTFGNTKAVDDVSFEVNKGEIFGLLGPNGAGKTTAIRIMLDIFKPDNGTAKILGGEMNEQKKSRIGYLPEDRGLYQDITLERCISYLASLKGLSSLDTQSRMNSYLERFDLAEHRKKKIKELSKGMQQKAQLIVTLIHEPELIIIDEPFSGLDPVNTQMVKDILRDESKKGTTVLMSTHQMHQVEALCDRIVLINHGKSVLYGDLKNIQRDFSGSEVDIRPLSSLPEKINGVVSCENIKNGTYRLVLEDSTVPQVVLKELVSQGVELEQFEIAMPTLDEIFIKVVKGTPHGRN